MSDLPQRFKDGFNKYARSGKLDVKDVLPAIEAAGEEDYTDDDVVDGLQMMEILNEPLSYDDFVELLNLLKDPKTITNDFTIFDPDRKGTVEEDQVRNWMRQYSRLPGKEIEDVFEKAAVTKDGALNYSSFVKYWSEQ